MRTVPEKWMGTTDIETRDRELLNAERLPFIKYTTKSPFVRKIFAKGEPGTPWMKKDWTVETNNDIMSMIGQAGGSVIGFPIDPQPHKNWQSMTGMQSPQLNVYDCVV